MMPLQEEKGAVMLYVLSCMNGRRSEWLPIRGVQPDRAGGMPAGAGPPSQPRTLLGGTVDK